MRQRADPGGIPERAIDDPAVRGALRRYRLGAVAWLVLPLLLAFVGLAGFRALNDAYRARQDDLDRHVGYVVAVADDDNDTSGESIVTVRFGPDHDHLRKVAIRSVVGVYSEDQAVTVLVDSDDPSTVTLPGENYRPGWTGALLGIVGFLVLLGIPTGTWLGTEFLLNARRIRRVVAAQGFRPVDVCFETNADRPDRNWTSMRHQLLELPDAPGRFWRWKPYTSTTWLDPEQRTYRVDAAHDGRNLVFRPPGRRDRLELARLPKTASRS